MKRVFLLALCLTAPTAFAQTWVEVGDATDAMPGQITVGAGPLTRIEGNIVGGADADLFCIRITDYTQFRATTVGQPGTLVDTQLFLFNANGIGVTHNDDSSATARSTLTSQFLTGNGIYAIGISGYNLDPTSVGGLIWNNSPFGTERAPDGPGQVGSLNGWTGTNFAEGSYSILIRGAEFCAVPEPATLAALGLGALALMRRRRSK